MRALLSLLPALGLAPALGAQTAFIRGDVNADGGLDLSDPICLLLHLYAGKPPPRCSTAADANDDGEIGTADALRLLRHLFSLGEPPAAPFPDCGADPTPEGPGCEEYPPCLADRDPVITEWTVPYSSSRPRDPYLDREGRVWFVGQTADYAAFLEPETGKFTRFNLPAGAGPHNLIVGDQIWYAGNGDAHIGKLDPSSGKVTVLPMPNPAAQDPHTLAFDREGDIWFTVQLGNFVGRLATATGTINLIRVPTTSARPYGIVVDAEDRPWFVESGTNKLAMIEREAMTIREITLPRTGTRPRRLGVASDGAIWYVDYAQGYLGRFTPATGAVKEWRSPGGSGAAPYGMALDHGDRIWFVETGLNPNRFIGFNPQTERFFSSLPIPSGGGTVRHMHFDPAARAIWFGTDTNTIGRAALEK
jgi:virginiamycin B lyase